MQIEVERTFFVVRSVAVFPEFISAGDIRTRVRAAARPCPVQKGAAHSFFSFHRITRPRRLRLITRRYGGNLCSRHIPITLFRVLQASSPMLFPSTCDAWAMRADRSRTSTPLQPVTQHELPRYGSLQSNGIMKGRVRLIRVRLLSLTQTLIEGLSRYAEDFSSL